MGAGKPGLCKTVCKGIKFVEKQTQFIEGQFLLLFVDVVVVVLLIIWCST